MTFWKKLLAVIAIFFTIIAVPSFLYGMLTDDDVPSSLSAASFAVAFVFLIGAVIYLAVDTAMRHNRQ